MTYSVEAVRAERQAQRTSQQFQFEFAGKTWTMVDPDDLPSDWFGWSIADYSRRFAELVIQEDFPGGLTVGDMNGLIGAWLGGTPGE